MRWLKRHFWGLFQLILSCALCMSLIVNLISWIELKREYREMKSVRLDPLGLRETRFPADTFSPLSPQSPVVLFFGDSRAAMWPAPNAPGWRFANRGIDGQTTEQAVARLGEQVSAVKPRIIILQCGINDLTAIGVLPEQRNAIIARCKENLHRMIELGRRDGATVIVTTIFPTGPVTLARRLFWSDQIKPAIDSVNQDLRNIHEPNVVIVDADEALTENGTMPQSYCIDTLHLTPMGYTKLNLALTNCLNSTK